MAIVKLKCKFDVDLAVDIEQKIIKELLAIDGVGEDIDAIVALEAEQTLNQLGKLTTTESKIKFYPRFHLKGVNLP